MIKGEGVLNAIWYSISSKQFLDEFITIISHLALSISEAEDDVQQSVEEAETSLWRLHDIPSKVSTLCSSNLMREIEPPPLHSGEVSILLEAGKTNPTNGVTITTLEREDEGAIRERSIRPLAY